jgi:hypothetical protein
MLVAGGLADRQPGLGSGAREEPGVGELSGRGTVGCIPGFGLAGAKYEPLAGGA